MAADSESRRLKYLSAAHVKASTCGLARMALRTEAGRGLGELDGVIVDPEARRLCYFVVETSEPKRRYLLPLCPTRLHETDKALTVAIEEDRLQQCPEFKPAAFEHFSDEDLVTALFTPAA
jgi:hypothetical protein